MLLPDARCGALENKTLKLHYSIKNKWHSTINNKFYPSLYSIYIILNYAINTQEEKEVVWNGLNSKLAVAPRRDMFTQWAPEHNTADQRKRDRRHEPRKPITLQSSSTSKNAFGERKSRLWFCFLIENISYLHIVIHVYLTCLMALCSFHCYGQTVTRGRYTFTTIASTHSWHSAAILWTRE